MSPKLLKTLALVFALFLAALVGLDLLNKPPKSEASLSKLDTAKLKTIRIQQLGGKKISLSRENNGWVLTEPVAASADQAKIAHLIENFKKIELEDVITETPEKQGLYQVDEASGTRIQLYGEDSTQALADFYIGKEAGDWSHFYWRAQGQNPIRISQGFAPYQVNQELNAWRDRSFVKVPQESVSKMRFEAGKTSYVLLKSSGSWSRNGKPVDSGLAGALLNFATPLDADDFADSSTTFKTAGLLSPSFRYELSTSSETIKVSFGSSQDGKTFAQREGSPMIVRLFDQKASRIKDKLKELK